VFYLFVPRISIIIKNIKISDYESRSYIGDAVVPACAVSCYPETFGQYRQFFSNYIDAVYEIDKTTTDSIF
jgi:hypothetical protein